MIVDGQTFPVKITKRNIEHFTNLGYKNLELRQVIMADGKHLTKGSKEFVKVRCDYCGEIINVKFGDYNRYKFDKYSCGACRQKKTSEYNLKERQDSLYKRALSFCVEMGYNLLTPKDKIYTSDTRVEYECPIHGVHETKIYTLITRHKCIDCGHIDTIKAHTKTQDEVYDYFKSFGVELLNKHDYSGCYNNNLKIICQECGNVFLTSYALFRHNNGIQTCPKCSQNISVGENRIKKYLISNNFEFGTQHRFPDCRHILPLPFDFYLPKLNICIEYDGEGHYMPICRGSITHEEANDVLKQIKKRDEIKTNYCKDNNIKLIRIPYWDYENIEKILTKELFT